MKNSAPRESSRRMLIRGVSGGMTGSQQGRAVRTARRWEGLLGPGDGDYTGTPVSEFLTGQFRHSRPICSESRFSMTVQLDCLFLGILGI